MSHGPVQYFVFSFPENQSKAGIVSALKGVLAKKLIRIVDLVFVQKNADGSTRTLEINDLQDEDFNAFSEIVDRVEGLLSEEDVHELAAEIPPGNAAALLVFEHAWATHLADAIRNANGQVLRQGFVPHDVVEAVLQARTQAV